MKSFSPKAPGDSRIFSMDFTKRLGSGETITGVTWASQVQNGSDPSPSAMISGSPDLTGAPLVKQRLIGGVAGTIYIITATVTTNLGNTLVGGVLLAVQNGGA